jgi:type IV secretion system protein TrbL
MRTTPHVKFLAGAALCLIVTPALAQSGATETQYLNQAMDQYMHVAQRWQDTLAGYATRLFWILATIEICWMGITLALKGGGIQDFVSAFIKRVMFIGFFFFVLQRGPYLASSIVDSFTTAAERASAAAGLSSDQIGLKPSNFINLAGVVLSNAFKAIAKISIWDIVAPAIGIIIALILALLLCIMGAFIALSFIEYYIVLSAGVLFLGFGGSSWTKDYAVSYLKYAMGIGAKFFFMQLIVAASFSLVNQWVATAGENAFTSGPMMQTAITAMLVGIMMYLLKTVPQIVQNFVSGVSVSGMPGIGAGGAVATGQMIASYGAKAAMAATGAGMAGVAALKAANAAVSSAAGTGGALSKMGGKIGGATGARIGASISRGASVLGTAGKSLASAAGRDVGNRLTGQGAQFGTMGGRIAASLTPKNNNNQGN